MHSKKWLWRTALVVLLLAGTGALAMTLVSENVRAVLFSDEFEDY